MNVPSADVIDVEASLTSLNGEYSPFTIVSFHNELFFCSSKKKQKRINILQSQIVSIKYENGKIILKYVKQKCCALINRERNIYMQADNTERLFNLLSLKPRITETLMNVPVADSKEIHRLPNNTLNLDRYRNLVIGTIKLNDVVLKIIRNHLYFCINKSFKVNMDVNTDRKTSENVSNNKVNEGDNTTSKRVQNVSNNKICEITSASTNDDNRVQKAKSNGRVIASKPLIHLHLEQIFIKLDLLINHHTKTNLLLAFYSLKEPKIYPANAKNLLDELALSYKVHYITSILKEILSNKLAVN